MSARISDFARAAYIRSFHNVRLDGKNIEVVDSF